MEKFNDIYEKSINDPLSFWGNVAKGIDWDKPFDKVCSDIDGYTRWFVGGKMNTCYNAVDRHVKNGRGEQVAIYYDSPVTNTKRNITYSELLQRVEKVAGILYKYGVTKGDKVIVYMPMIPEAVIAMLACARIGAVHSVVFGGFASQELALRIDDAKPKMILSASCGIEIEKVIDYKKLLDKAIDIAKHKPDYNLIYQREQKKVDLHDKELDWQEEEANSKPMSCVSVESTHPLYILYTSGTTGKPKGIVRGNGDHAVAISWSMANLYNVKAGDVFWAASDVGWVVGHSYIVYGPLLHGCSTIVYEGKPVKTPNASAFWRICAEYNVNVFFTAPTAFRAVKKEDPLGELAKHYDMSSLQSVFVAGERCDSDTIQWIKARTGKVVVDHWWQTETGWSIAGNPLGIEEFPTKAGSATRPMPGYNVNILDEEGNELPNNELGNITIKLPLPPGCLMGVWGNEKRLQQSYLNKYPGYYLTGDSGYIDNDGYLWVLGRIDGVINVAGHRLSTGQMEEVIATHQDVAECAVIGVNDKLKGQLPIGFVVLKENVDKNHSDVIQELISLVREKIGAVAAFKIIAIVKRLPKTRSGKILRTTMLDIADGKEWKMPSTIEEPSVIDEIKEAIKQLGYPL